MYRLLIGVRIFREFFVCGFFQLFFFHRNAPQLFVVLDKGAKVLGRVFFIRGKSIGKGSICCDRQGVVMPDARLLGDGADIQNHLVLFFFFPGIVIEGDGKVQGIGYQWPAIAIQDLSPGGRLVISAQDLPLGFFPIGSAVDDLQIHKAQHHQAQGHHQKTTEQGHSFQLTSSIHRRSSPGDGSFLSRKAGMDVFDDQIDHKGKRQGQQKALPRRQQ